METSGDLDQLIKRVREKARAEADKIVERAVRVADKDFAAAEEKWQSVIEKKKAAIAAEIESQKRAAQAKIAIHERRAIMEKMESAVNQIFGKALQKLQASPPDEQHLELLIGQIREAADFLKLKELRVRLNPKERKMLMESDYREKLDGLSLSIDSQVIETAGGPIVTDISGRLLFDNTYEARLERLSASLRSRIIDILELRIEEETK
ncbi:MAG: hypothetical protein J7L22_09310 [Candidatus Marinimicrobia bacterium]|nr:hypothetical protein [Candidatus Neomarinimicrobiota bacterium]RKY62255.1 MAG: hypothetical protein DRP96_00715 [Candidatus Neomarinimicrobiota bacterium]